MDLNAVQSGDREMLLGSMKNKMGARDWIAPPDVVVDESQDPVKKVAELMGDIIGATEGGVSGKSAGEQFLDDPTDSEGRARKSGRRKAFSGFYVVLFTLAGLMALTFTVIHFFKERDEEAFVRSILPTLATAENMAEVAKALDAAYRIRWIQMQDTMCYVLTMQCGLAQYLIQSNGIGAGQLLKSCSEMEIRCASTLQSEIILSDVSQYKSGKCYGLDNQNDDKFLFCMSQQPVEFPSAETTGLLLETTISRNGGVPFPNPYVPGGIPLVSSFPYLSPSFYSNPQFGSILMKQERNLIERDIYGIFVVYSYDTLWNVNYITQQFGGSGITADQLLPGDGAFYVNLNTRHSTTLDGTPGSFGQITSVLECAKFDGVGNIYADDELVIISGEDSICGWDISGGLDSVISIPTISRDFIADATEDDSLSLVSPSDLNSYIDPNTGKRFFLIAMDDIVDTSSPGDLLCDTLSMKPGACGGFILLERDSLLQDSPAASISKFTPSGLNNGNIMPTPGDFIVARDRNIFVVGSTLSRLYLEQNPCSILYAFLVHVLNETDTFEPPPSYDYTSPVSDFEDTHYVSFYRYSDGLYLFNLSTLWSEEGDILKDSPIETLGSPPDIEYKNHLFDPNLHPINEWKNITGYLPILIQRASSFANDLPLFYGIDFFTGGIFSVSPTDPSSNSYEASINPDVAPWKLVYVAWLPYIVNGLNYDRPSIYDILQFLNNASIGTDFVHFLRNQFLPFPTDMKLTNDGRFMFVAANGLGQVIVFRRPDMSKSRLEYCTSVQVTAGQYNYTRLPFISHPARPGIPLHGGPARLSIDPSNRFLYVSTGDPIDDCIYPSASIYGSVLMRYSINSFSCSEETLLLDPAFLVTSFDLPSKIVSTSVPDNSPFNSAMESTARTLPARFGELTFAVN